MMLKVFCMSALVFPAAAALAQDATQTCLTTPNFPLTSPLPVNPNAVPSNDLRLTSGSTNAFWLLMGAQVGGANMTDGQSVRNTFFMNYLTGNQTQTMGSPVDTGQGGNSPFAAVARHYAVGDPNDLHQMRTNGLALRAVCSANHTNCTSGNVYGGMIRVPFEIRPGMTVEVTYKSPAGKDSWAPIWMFSGSQISPGPGGNPYAGFGTSATLLQLPSYQHEFEIDLNDNFPRWNDNPSVPVGRQFDYGTPNNYGVKWSRAPHWIYGANVEGYAYVPNGGPAFVELPINWSSGFHSLVMSWDGVADTIYEFVDGTLVASSYMEYSQAPTYVDATGVRKVQAMHLIIGNQAIPQWLSTASTAVENDGISDGWTIVVQEIAAWYGTVANPTSYAP
jgi:hypothetical protein